MCDFLNTGLRYRVIRFSFSDHSVSHSKYFHTLTAARIYVRTLLRLQDYDMFGIFILTF